MKKFLAIALSVAATLSLFACSDPNNDEEKVVGDRVTAEFFRDFAESSFCCENYTQTTPQNGTQTYTIMNYTYTITSTGEQVVKRAGNYISIYTDVTSVTTMVVTDSSGSESSSVTTSVDKGTVYAEKADDTYYVYEYDETNGVWTKEEDRTYGAYFDTKAYLDDFGFSESIQASMDEFCNIENWTFDETTGEYVLEDFVISGIDAVVTYVYKFKDEHIIKLSEKMNYAGVESDTTTYYSDHGTTTVALPTVASDSSTGESEQS